MYAALSIYDTEHAEKLGHFFGDHGKVFQVRHAE
jgi:hypothetical protein